MKFKCLQRESFICYQCTDCLFFSFVFIWVYVISE